MINVKNSNNVRDWLKQNSPEILKAFRFEAWNDALNEIFNIKGEDINTFYFGEWSLYDAEYLPEGTWLGQGENISPSDRLMMWVTERSDLLTKQGTTGSLIKSTAQYNIYLIPKSSKENPFYD